MPALQWAESLTVATLQRFLVYDRHQTIFIHGICSNNKIKDIKQQKASPVLSPPFESAQ